MKEEQGTRELLLKAGKEEFLENGFEKASLRRICRKAEVTTGAVYFFFENKEDLFHQIVAGTLEQMRSMGRELSEQELNESRSSSDSDKKLMEFLWKNRGEVLLLLEKSAGTRYEGVRDEIFSKIESYFSRFFEKYGNMGKDKNLIRIVVEMRLQGYMKLLKGAYSMEEALRLSELIGYYADGGFYSLMEHGKKVDKE